MTTDHRPHSRDRRAPWCLALAFLAFAANAAAQPAAAPVDGIETDPIRCWWKTDRVAVHLGERFGVTLTCSVIETAAIKVVPTTTQLDPGAVQLSPFEVVAGVRHDDVIVTPWRYVQYDYTLRLLGEGFFGQDVNIPALSVTYNIQAATGDGAQGRDQQYILPPLQMRALSIVPKSAADIRDSSTETFAAVEARRFRSTSAFVASGILFGFAGVLVILAGARVLAPARRRRKAVDAPLPSSTVLTASLRGLAKVKAAAARDGWSPELARRALTTLRVGGAVAIDQPVAQMLAVGDVGEREGQVVLRRGLLRPKRAMISAATTAQAIERHLEDRPAAPAKRRALLEKMRDALRAFSIAGYGREREIDSIALNSALDDGAEAMKGLRLRSLWPTSPASGGLKTVGNRVQA